MEEKEHPKAPAIGSTVRLTSINILDTPKSVPKRRTQGVSTLSVACRSIVATLPDENGCVSLVQDDLAPAPLLGRMGKFLVAPIFNSVGVEVNECEAAVSDLKPLLAFEQDDDTTNITDNAQDMGSLANSYKGYGDQLLRLHDYTCAISYYEAALHFVSSKVAVIGGTLVVKKKGHSVIAEVDCVENDEKNNPQYDVTFLSGEEATISQKEILLAVWAKDVTFLQPRILLNLSRCLLKLANVDTTRGNASCVGENMSSAKNSRQERYRLAAVRGVSIAMSLCEYHILESSDDSAEELDSLAEKARIVRSRAFLDLKKIPNATVDAKKVLAKKPENREAQALLADIRAMDAYNKSVDKRLSKEVCRWVQTATNSTKGTEAMDKTDESHRSE